MKKIIYLMFVLILSALVIGDSAEMSVTVIAGTETVTVCESICDYDTIQGAVDYVSPGDRIEVKTGIYNEEVKVFYKENIKIYGETRDSVLVKGIFSEPGFWIENSTGIDIENMTILEQFHGIYILNSSNNTFDNLIIRNNSYNGVFIGISNYNNITDSYISNSSDYSGISMQNSNFTLINNTILNYNNLAGIYLELGKNNIISNNIIQHNAKGIYYAAVEAYDFDTRINNDNTKNKDCDRYYGDTTCYDYTTPATITDLTAYPSGNDYEIILNWKAVGDNWLYGTVDSYILKYSLAEINEGNWDSADTYTQSWTPQVNGSLEEETVTMDDFDTYYFAIKSQDDASLISPISNSPSSISPKHDIAVLNLTCVNAKNGYPCNHSTSGSTNYYYDILNFSGWIENRGNLDETKDVTAGIYLTSDWISTNITEFLLEKEENTSIGVKQVNVTGVNELQTNYKFRLQIGSSYLQHSMDTDEYPFWSIESQTNLDWYFDSLYPPEVGGTKSDDIFLILINISNIKQNTPLYDIPTTISINDTFSVNLSKHSDRVYCDVSTGNKTCYTDILQYSEEYPFWYINPLSAGDYNITIEIGHNPLDHILINTVITITNP